MLPSFDPDAHIRQEMQQKNPSITEVALASLFNNKAGLRETVAALPEKPVAMPYDMRTEVTWIDFSNHTNPLGTPKSFVQEMHTALVDGEHTYMPDYDGRAFRQGVGLYLGIDADSILPGTSVAQLLTYAACAFEYCTVGIPVPCPIAYETAMGNAGHSVVELRNPVSFAPIDAFRAHKAAQFSGVVLGNPTYPTSRLLPRQTLLNYLETCDWVIVDESNIELTIGGESMAPLVEQYPNLIVVRSVSTTFGMPGIPLYYLVANKELVAHIEQYNAGTDLGMFAEVLAQQIPQQHTYLEETHDFLDAEIPWMQCLLSFLPGIRIHPAEGNFVLCHFSPTETMRMGARSAEELVISLQLAGFLADDLDDTPGLPDDSYFAVSVRLHEENERLITALKNILNR